jgi:hypothetical protein
MGRLGRGCWDLAGAMRKAGQGRSSSCRGAWGGVDEGERVCGKGGRCLPRGHAEHAWQRLSTTRARPTRPWVRQR